MNIDIICPLYNAENDIERLYKSLLMQKNIEINKIRFILTESEDNTEKKMKEMNLQYKKIEKKEFSHSCTREKEAFESDADILVFITQDVEIVNNNWLEQLVKPIILKEVDAAYSRQITKYNNLEKYTREKNYPEKSYIVSKEDIEKLGLRTFFFSDASSAIRASTFKKLNGYDGKKLTISEDMYIAYKIITNGYKIKYCAESVVYHSHNFTLKQLYRRYYDTGVFFKQNSYLDKFGTNRTGGGMAKYILKRAIEDKNVKVVLKFLPNMVVRFLGMKIGKAKGKCK